MNIPFFVLIWKKREEKLSAFKVIYVKVSQIIYAKILFMSAVTFHEKWPKIYLVFVT